MRLRITKPRSGKKAPALAPTPPAALPLASTAGSSERNRRPPHLAICASAGLEQRFRKGPLAIPRHAPSLTPSDVSHSKVAARIFVPDLLMARRRCFWEPWARYRHGGAVAACPLSRDQRTWRGHHPRASLTQTEHSALGQCWFSSCSWDRRRKPRGILLQRVA